LNCDFFEDPYKYCDENREREVIQLYIRELVGNITRPVKELKGFEMVELKEGEAKTINFILNK
jgi:beta-glucosidase